MNLRRNEGLTRTRTRFTMEVPMKISHTSDTRPPL